ncbi:hypothetical protein N7454_005775, partial [Penicillium verhagenii]
KKSFIDKLDFLEAYLCGRLEAFKSQTIQNSFAATGLVPKILANDVQLQKQAYSIRALWKQRTKTLLSLLNSMLDQILKAYQMSTCMQSTVLLNTKVANLRAAMEKKKQKRTRSAKQIPYAEGLIVLEVQSLIESLILAPEASNPTPAMQPPAPLQQHIRALPRCSECNIQGCKRPQHPNLIK